LVRNSLCSGVSPFFFPSFLLSFFPSFLLSFFPSLLPSFPPSLLLSCSEAKVLLHTLANQGFSKNYAQLTLARLGQGIGESIFNPAAIALIYDLFSYDSRAFPSSIYNAALLFGMGISSFVARLAEDEELGWRLTMHILAILGIGLGIFIFLFVWEPNQNEKYPEKNIQVVFLSFFLKKKPQSPNLSNQKKEEETYFALLINLRNDNNIQGFSHRKPTAGVFPTIGYLMSLNSSWKLFVAVGFRYAGSLIVWQILPSYLRDIFPQHSSTISFHFGMASLTTGTISALIGGLLTKLYSSVRRSPTYISLIGTLLACPSLVGLIFSANFFSDEMVCFLAYLLYLSKNLS